MDILSNVSSSIKHQDCKIAFYVTGILSYVIIAAGKQMEKQKADQEIQRLLEKAQTLEDSTLREQCDVSVLAEEVYEQNHGKGHFGNGLETAFFGIMPNSIDRPDFWPIPLELKSAPF